MYRTFENNGQGESRNNVFRSKLVLVVVCDFDSSKKFKETIGKSQFGLIVEHVNTLMSVTIGA